MTSEQLPTLSRSKAPKRDRAPYQPKEEAQPHVNDYFRSASYIDQRAAMGEFRGSPGRETGTVAVLHYLWRNAWRTNDNPEKADPGIVMAGKSKLPRIAADTCLSYSTVQRAVDWLIRAEWLEYGYREDQTMILMVRMDMAGHRDRLSLLGKGVVSLTTGVVTQTTVGDGCGQTDNGVLSERQRGVVSLTTPRCQRDHTIQGLQGFDRASYSGNSAFGSVTAVDPPSGENRGGQAPHTPQDSGESPAEQRAWIESVRSGAQRPAEEPMAPDELRAAVLACVQEHASEHAPIRPDEVAPRVRAEQEIVHDTLIDLAGGGLARYEGEPPLDAKGGKYWPRSIAA